MKYLIPSLLLATGFLTAAEPPEAIRAYYERAAFLATYSMQKEREKTASFPAQWLGPANGRVTKIAEAQKLNAQMILRVDTGMPLGPKWKLTSPGYVALSEIVECRVSASTVTVKLRPHQLASDVVKRFCALYDQVAGDPVNLPTLDQRLAMTSDKVSPIVIHKWVHTPDGWRKQEADWLLLSR